MPRRCLPALSFAAALPLAFALAGCSGATATSAQATGIGPSGGTLSASDGTAIDVPAGALKSVEEVTLEETTVSTSATAGVLEPVGTAYEIGPDSVTFAAPVTVTVTVDPSQLAARGDMMSDVWVFWTVPGQDGWSSGPGAVKDATHVTLATSQMGTYVAGIPLAQSISCGPAEPAPGTMTK